MRKNMSFKRAYGFAVAGTLLLGSVVSAEAQTTYPSVKISGRLQSQFYYFGNEDYAASGVGTQSNFFLRRARIEARAQLNEYITFYIQPSFEGGRATSGSCSPVVIDAPLPDTASVSCSLTGGIRLRDAWIDVRLSKPEAKTAFTLRMGQEKRPFSRYELLSSNNLPSIERGAGRGLRAAASNDIFTSQGFESHDVGASARVEHKLDATGRILSVVAGVYNGRGESVQDNNEAKSFGARVNADLYRKLSIGGSFFSHDQIVGSDSAFRNKAFGVDAQWNKPGEEGLFVLAEYLSGEVAAADTPKMTGIQALAAYNIRMKSPTSWLYAIEPSVRFDYADPNTEVDDNGATLITAGVGFYVSSRAQFRVAYENQSFQADGAESISGVRTALTVNF
jgi:hypothetical protein